MNSLKLSLMSMQDTNFNRDYNILVSYAAACLNNNGVRKYNTIEPHELVSEAYMLMLEADVYSLIGMKSKISNLSYKALAEVNARNVSLTWDAGEGTHRLPNNIEDIIAEKTCKHCKELKPIQVFRDVDVKGRVTPNGHSYCDDCYKEKARVYAAVTRLCKLTNLSREQVNAQPELIAKELERLRIKKEATKIVLSSLPDNADKKEVSRAYHRAWHEKNRKGLTDRQMIKILVNRGYSREEIDANPSLIEEQRQRVIKFQTNKGCSKDAEYKRRYRKEWEAKQKAELSDWYVKQQLGWKGYKSADFAANPSLVTEKRAELLMQRQLAERLSVINAAKRENATKPLVITFLPDYANTSIAIYK